MPFLVCKKVSSDTIFLVARQQIIYAEQTDLDEWVVRARRNGLGDYPLKTLRMMFDYYDKYGFWGNSNTLHKLLGRPPTSYASFIERVVRNKSVSINSN